MRFPSTNTDGRNPAAGGVLSNVESSHGCLLDGGSTGAQYSAAGDDANISVRLRGKGTGRVTLGDSSQTVLIPGASVSLGSTTVPNSTASAATPIRAVLTSTFSWQHAVLSSGQYGEIVLASTTCNAEPGDFVAVTDFAATTNVTVAQVRLSTVATSRVTIVVVNSASSATSTFSGTGRVSWFDMTA